ncbi:MAG: hypothetical protein ACYS15_05055 [Planctomycetota bacterium]|jgi:hypothetical protein
MSRPRWAKVARIREALCCPQCGYSLRGVPGDVGTCPECGIECDLGRLIVNQWTGPWHHAPKFNQVLAPLTTVSLGVWGVLLVFTVEMQLQRTPTYTALASGSLVVAWLCLMWRLRNLMLDGAAMGLALLAHGIFAGYVVSLVGTIWLLWLAISAGSLMVAAPALAALLPVVGLAWVCRRGEKYIAARCIRQYLVQMARPAPPLSG